MNFSPVRRRLTVAGVVGLALALLPPSRADADDASDHERARRALEAGEVMPLRTVLEQVERDYPGEILEVELDREDGVWVYELKLIRKGGDVLKLEVDARDGSVRGIRGRDVRAAGQDAGRR
ncbi:MAG TPA: hypothetical protein DCL01_03375 [Thauera sp.]|nr:hypothetical protein [Thauera sp.]